MKSVSHLPEGYREIFAVDLQKNKKKGIFVNVIAGLILVAMVVPMAFFVPMSTMFDVLEDWPRLLALVGALVLYMVLHELVHGVAMKLCGTKKVKYGYTGIYAFAGSEDYYDRSAYIFSALAPVVFWGLVLLAVQFFVPLEWFWIVYWIQIANCSGAAGDLYVTVKFSRLPKDILVKDHGVGMVVYSKEQSKESL